MGWMNELDVDDAHDRWSRHADEFPNLAAAATTMLRLVKWVNRNSDGWAYWKVPANAADRLQDLLTKVDRFDPQDISEADLKAAYTPIKAMLTRTASKVRDPGMPWVFPPTCKDCGNLIPGGDCGYCAEQARLAAKRTEAITAIENRWVNEANLGSASTHDLAVMAVEALATIGAL